MYSDKVIIEYSKQKDKWLRKFRGVGFGDVLDKIIYNETLGRIKNPSKNFPKQEAFVVLLDNYVYLIPFVQDKDKIFLKTIYPSRKHTKLYLKNLLCLK